MFTLNIVFSWNNETEMIQKQEIPGTNIHQNFLEDSKIYLLFSDVEK